MNTQTQAQRFSEATLRQVRMDCNRAMMRARFCPKRSEIFQMRCVDFRVETETDFGNQLWYFEGVGVDQLDHRHCVYGAVEYSTQYGLNELVEDGVFPSESQRERFRNLYEREVQRPDWRQPAHRMLALGVITVSAIWLGYLLLTTLSV